MFEHFFHNGLSIVEAYAVSMELTTLPVSPEHMDKSAPWSMIVLFALIGTLAVVLFRNHLHRNDRLAERV